ncbi:MAG: hypothetical protein WB760_17945 [Xanthobacteraceae bacterium]
MSSGKKKSSGWRPMFKRETPAEYRAKRAAERAVTARRDCDRLGRWRSCPLRQCRRAGGCGGEPLQCQTRSRPATAQHRNAAPRPSNTAETVAPDRTAAPVMSAAEAAAAIKASIAAMPPEPFAREELEVVYRDGGIHYAPRQR